MTAQVSSNHDAETTPKRSLRADFRRDGFVVLRGAVSPDKVAELRTTLTGIFDAPSSYEGDVNGHVAYNRIYFDAFNRYPALQWLPFNPPLVNALRAIAGDDFVYLPEVGIHDSGYGGWHKDSTAQESAGLRFHWEPDFCMIQCALYLQDGHPDYAGGLDVAVGSHRRRDRLVPHNPDSRVTTLMSRALYKLKTWDDNRRGTTLDTRAGDMVLFDYRLDHKATTPRIRPVPASRRKLAVFCAASANNRHADSYIRFIKSRPDYVYLKSYRVADALRERAKTENIRFLEP